MIGSLFHILRLARAGYVLAHEGVFVNVDPSLAPPQARFGLAVARLLARNELFHVSSLADYEARKALLTQGANEDHVALLDSLLSSKCKMNTGWDAAISQSLKIARQFKQRLWVDSADTMHVGWALALGADIFASFDRKSGPRSLALCMGMKLWPDATSSDYEQLKRLR